MKTSPARSKDTAVNSHSRAATHLPRMARRAFSLIELLIVIAILLAIGGLVVVNLLPAKSQADIDLTRVQIDQFGSAMKRFQLDMKRIPLQDEGLALQFERIRNGETVTEISAMLKPANP